ncbi:MAG TPA: hypothetical protein VGT60_05040 [Candidatus Limnocylindria bacterium]|nr:hypothetical protein [Candidatus Limnocylindria bacterium]
MRVTRCPRCRAEDIAADAHPARVLANGVETPVFVCRGCYRPAELEFRIACETAGVAYRPLPIRDALRTLRAFYLARLAEVGDPDLLIDDDERRATAAPIRAALADVDRRLAIGPVPPDT